MVQEKSTTNATQSDCSPFAQNGEMFFKSNRSQMFGKSLKDFQGASRGTPLLWLRMKGLETRYYL